MYLTVVDAMLFSWLNTMRSTAIEDADTNFLGSFPQLEKRVNLIAAHPSVAAYYSTKQDSPLYAVFLPKLTVAYFDGRGLAEVPRMMLTIAGIKFEDKRYPISVKDGEGPIMSRIDYSGFLADSESGKLAANLGRLPVLETAHGTIGGSKGMRNYIANTFGLAGASSFERAQVETICDVVNDINETFGKQEDKEKWFTVSAKDGSKQGERQLQWFLQGLEALVGEEGFSVGSSFTTADVIIYHFFGDHATTKGNCFICCIFLISGFFLCLKAKVQYVQIHLLSFLPLFLQRNIWPPTSCTHEQLRKNGLLSRCPCSKDKSNCGKCQEKSTNGSLS